MIVKDGQCVKKINEYYKELKKELNDKKNDLVVIDFKGVQRVDLSMLQLAMAARCKARSIGKEIELKNVSDRIKNQIMVCGMKF